MRGLLLVLILFAPLAAQGAESVAICFNYGCAGSAQVAFSDARLREVRALLADAPDATAERGAIAAAVGRMYRIAAGQSPIGADRAGNFLDDGAVGRMDCIDHSMTTGRFLALLESRGWLRFHRVAERARRTRIIFQHFSAVIEETDPLAPEPGQERHQVPLSLARSDCQNDEEFPRVGEPEMPPAQHAARRFAVDSWFVEPGEPAVVLPLEEWMNGEGPNVQ